MNTRRGCVYEGKCKLCREDGLTATYYGESGRNAYHRINQHEKDIKNQNTKNAFAKHIQNKHQGYEKKSEIFEYRVISTHRSCLDRQVHEGVRITEDNSDELLNSKNEYHQPSVTHVTTTREVNSVRQRES